MFTPEHFQTASLRRHPHGESVMRILAAAINAVEPGEAIRRHVHRSDDVLTVAGRKYPLAEFERVVIISIGKAGWGMAEALSGILADWPHTGLVITKHAPNRPDAAFTVMEGGHPVPSEASLHAGTQVLELASTLMPCDLLLCCISGGGSALVTAPQPGITLADLQDLTSSLLACGARIDEINTLRRALDRVKGGGLARAANGAAILSLILSDVIGNPLATIASGPTVPNPTTPADALAILERYQLTESVSPAMLASLRTENIPQDEASFSRVQNVIVGSNLQAAQAALMQASAEGFNPYLLRTDLQGEAREAGLELVNTLRFAAQRGDPVLRPACIVAGGETTVTLNGSGKGGRNSELALAAAIGLEGFPNVMLVTLATDGEDGPTDAAGAVVTGESWKLARNLGLSPSDHLRRNDSYTFFAALDDLLKPGPTGTNVNDLNFLFTF